MTLLRIFLEANLCPNIIRKGKNIILLEIPEFQIRFLASNNYVAGNEVSLAQQFGINFKKKLFPEAFLLKDNFSYVGKVPLFEYFCSILDFSFKESEVRQYINEHGQDEWNFKQKITEYFDQKVKLLLESFLEFIRQSFNFQFILQKSLKVTTLTFINPFNNPLCTLGSFVYLMYKIFYMNNLPIFIVENEYGKNQKQVSKLEHEYCALMDYFHPSDNFQFAFNNKDGPKYFKEAIPDLYSPVTKEIFFFNGCYYHGHYEKCLINKNISAQSPHPFGITYETLNQQFFDKLESLMKNHPEISKATVEWECNFKKKKTLPEAKLFFEQKFIPHCLKRLTPRDTVRGSFSDVYGLKWSQVDFPDEKFLCTDVNGLYSFCAIQFPYMVGKYEVLIGKSLENLSILENHFTISGVPVMGAILLKVLPPKDLFAPFLLYRKKDGSIVNTLCSFCSETNSKTCSHTDEQRSFIATYMISEIEFALTLNYKILQIYEAHIYTNKDFILRDFIKKLNFFKTLYSDCLKDIPAAEQAKYCELLNDKMELKEPQFTLQPNLISSNLGHRNYFKLLSNALFGKFIQRTDQTEIKFVKNQDGINDTFFSTDRIEDFMCPNENICMLFLKKNVFKLPPNRKQNVYIGSQVTAFARETIYRQLQKVLATPNTTVYHVECDSIYFSLPKSSPCPLDLSYAVGDFKIEYSNRILSYHSFGPKHYNLNFLNSNNEIENICKYSGLSLKNEANRNMITSETFENFLAAFINDLEKTFIFHQTIDKANIKSFSVTSKEQKFTFRNKISNRRHVDVTNKTRLITYPHGF